MPEDTACFDAFRIIFLLRYEEAQKSKHLAPWYSLQSLLEAAKPLSTVGSGVIERSFINRWLTRINKRIAQLNVTDE